MDAAQRLCGKCVLTCNANLGRIFCGFKRIVFVACNALVFARIAALGVTHDQCNNSDHFSDDTDTVFLQTRHIVDISTYKQI